MVLFSTCSYRIGENIDEEILKQNDKSKKFASASNNSSSIKKKKNCHLLRIIFSTSSK